ncbi:netrin-4 [Electrophorus electricus]|uniref:netrin-4 n=1 Tax=Electrophorus electricus TaxID=8005 RepID=UPI0015D0A6D8|nr:netrin-4 [Electrophorus electricus]
MRVMDRWILFFAVVCSSPHLARSGCENRVCNPRMGNLAVGRNLRTETQCGSSSPEYACSYDDSSCTARCEVCDATVEEKAHPPTSMTDSPFTRSPTWWQSAPGIVREALQLDLEEEFYFTHLIIIFRSARPAAMELERSRDFGRTWNRLQLYARNCSGMFGVEDGRQCTQKYSSAQPCSGGEVIYRALLPWQTLEPYSSEAHTRLGITNLRVRLLQAQQCPCGLKEHGAALVSVPYAIYDLILKGACLCHGHADQCVPAAGYSLVPHLGYRVVHGKCVCQHHTAGDHCERCHPFFNEQPWKPASGLTGEAHQCSKCKCNGHAESCHFDMSAWLRSGRRSGGVCHCLHHTEGQHCQRCQRGFYRHPQRPQSDASSCTSCLCHPVGTVNCNSTNGHCLCKPGVADPYCDQCMLGYWAFGDYGCTPCNCAGSCDPHTGDCMTRSDTYQNNTLFRVEELFSVLTFPDKCVCKPHSLGNSKVFCTMKYSYALKVRVLAAHDKGSHAEVDVKVLKVLWSRSALRLTQGNLTLYPESWTSRGCTCPVLYPGVEYLVAGHEDVRRGRLLVNMKSLVKPWRTSLSHRVLQLLKTKCV